MSRNRKNERGIIPFLTAVPVIALLRLLQFVPLPIAEKLGQGIGVLLYRVGVRRTVVMKNLSLAFPEKSDAAREKIAKGAYRNFGGYIFQFLRFCRLGEKQLGKMVYFEDVTCLTQAVAQGKGVMCNSAHFGNFELSAWALTQHCDDFYAVANSLRNVYLNREWVRLHEQIGIKTIFRGTSMSEASKRLRGRTIIGLLIDQSGRGRGIFLPFFGKPASFHRGPALLAIRRKIPFITVFPVPDGDKEKLVLEPIEVRRTGNLEADIGRIMGEYARRLESYVRAYPDRWFWFHNRWKARPPEEEAT